MPTQVTDRYIQASLECYKWESRVILEDYNVAANQVIPQGGIVALETGSSVDDVQTLTNTATGGTFAITVGNALNAVTAFLTCTTLTAAQLQTALNAAYATLCPGRGPAGFVTVTSGPFTSGAGSLVVTFNNGTAHSGPLSNNPQTLMVINNTNATGGTVTVAHTTVGVNQGALVNYAPTLVAAPTTAPALTVTGSDGTLAVGSYTVAYTYVTAAGESIPSYGSTIAVASTNHIAVASITSIPAGVTSVNVYLNGMFVKNQAVTTNATGAFNILAPAASTSAHPAPTVSTAFLASDGSQVPVGAAWYAMAADPTGLITFGATAPTGNQYRGAWYVGNAAIAGYFPCANLSVSGVAGIDQNTVMTLGRLIVPSLTAGVVLFNGA